jgi:hypothetical protein
MQRLQLQRTFKDRDNVIFLACAAAAVRAHFLGWSDTAPASSSNDVLLMKLIHQWPKHPTSPGKFVKMQHRQISDNKQALSQAYIRCLDSLKTQPMLVA